MVAWSPSALLPCFPLAVPVDTVSTPLVTVTVTPPGATLLYVVRDVVVDVVEDASISVGGAVVKVYSVVLLCEVDEEEAVDLVSSSSSGSRNCACEMPNGVFESVQEVRSIS